MKEKIKAFIPMCALRAKQERNGIYYVPNLVLKQEEKVILNKYGRMRLNYLKTYKKAEYTILFMNGELNKLTLYLWITFLKKRLKKNNYDILQNLPIIIGLENNLFKFNLFL